MEINYKNNRLQRSIQLKNLAKSYGTNAKKINQRIQELTSATTLEDMAFIPGANCHELVGNRKGELAVWNSTNQRIIFKPNHDPVPIKEDGGMDWVQITHITILAINEDYH